MKCINIPKRTSAAWPDGYITKLFMLRTAFKLSYFYYSIRPSGSHASPAVMADIRRIPVQCEVYDIFTKITPLTDRGIRLAEMLSECFWPLVVCLEGVKWKKKRQKIKI